MADLKTTNIYGDAYINNKVGIATNAPATRLQIGQLLPTAATEGIQFGDDTSARIYRDSSTVIKVSGGFTSTTFINAGNYLQTSGNLIYPASQTATQRLEVGNASGNAWIDGLTIAQGGNVTVYNNLTVNNAATVTNDLTVNGNTYLGNAGGDTVFVNDIIRIGATDSGDASLFFGEGSVAGSDYGARWYWDSGYTFTWYTRNAGTDTSLFDYVTNDTTYLNWRRNFHMQNKSIDYTGQIHFNAGTRFAGQDTSILLFRSDSTSSGGIRVQNGSIATKGYTGYWDAGGGGILNDTGNWAVRYNFGSANSGGTLYGAWTVNGNISATNLSGTNTGDQSIGNGTITIAAGTGVGVGSSNTFTTNQSGATTVTITNTGVTALTTNTGLSTNASATGAVTITNTGVTNISAGTGIGTSASTGAVTITNNGVTSNVAGTGISVSGATGAVTITNGGVTSLAGTTNRVTVSAATGAVTLNLPQDIHTSASPTFSGLSLTSVSTTGATITNLTGAYQNTTVYDSPRTQSATPSRGIRAPASSIQFTDSYAIAPFYTYRSTGDWPVPYGIGWGTGGESSGIFQRYASNGSSFGDMIFYTGNDGSGAFSFRRHTWEGTTYFAAGSGELNTELFRIDWAGKATATSFALSGGFTITHPGSGYAEFSNWVLLGTTGFYSSTNSAHLLPNGDSYGSWKITGTRNGWGGIEFGNNGVSLMMGSDTVGFHQNTNGWLFRVHNGSGFIYKGSWGGGTAATILDSSNAAYAWNMNQYVRTTDSPTFVTVTAALTGNATTATTLQTARNINGTSFNGSAAITTANWGTARTLTIGSTGKSVDGSAAITWSLAEIGAAATNQTMFVGTTSVAINRASAGQTLTGVNIDGNAGSADVATYARRVDGATRTSFTVGGNKDNYYPVIFNIGSGATALQYSEFVIERGGYEDPGYTFAGGNIFSTLNIRFSCKSSGWGYGATYENVEMHGYTTQMVANWQQMSEASKLIVWLRGATIYYFWNVVANTTLHDGNSGGTSLTLAQSPHYSYTYTSTQTVQTKALYGKYVNSSTGTSGIYVAGNVLAEGLFSGPGTGLTGTASSLSIGGNAGTATILQTARNINGTSFNGSAAITTATWGTARTLTIGSTGKSVDGSAAITWSLAEIGAAATNQTMFVGTTSVAINRASAAQTLTGVSIDGSAASCTGNAATATGQQSGVHFTLNTGGAGYGLVGQYNADLHQGLFAMGAAYTLGAGGTLANFYGVSWSYDYAGRQLNTGYNLQHCMAVANAGVVATVIGLGIWTNGLIRANGAISSAGTITAAAFSGPLTGNATTATNGFTSKPGWAGNTNLIQSLPNFNNSVPSGFYEYTSATNSPSATWYNLINVRHSNTGNDHGFQLAMSYYDNNLWFRSYQGGTGANNGTFQSWAKTLSDQNYTDYTVTKTGTGASGTWAINVTGNAGTATNVAWSGITSKPTTLSGFGITDAASINGATNQVFSTNALYIYEWIRFKTDTGIYWDTGTYAGWHIYPQALWGMSLRSASTDCGLQLRRSTNVLLGSVYSDGTSIGFLDASNGWGASFTIAGVMNRGSVPGSLVTGNISGNAATATSLANFTNQSGARYTTDFNSIVTTGFFNAEGTPTNSPGGSYGQLISAKGIDTGLQIYGGYTNDNLWFRGWHTSGGTFTAWRTVIHNGNIGSQTVATAGSCTGNAATATTTTGNAGSVTYLPGRTDATAYPVLWGAAYTNAVGTIAYSCAAVTIQSSTGILSATSFSGAGTGLSGTAASLTAGAANSVAWTNVSGRPTAVSSFTNDSGYLTSVAIANGSVTLAKIENITAYTILGNSNASATATPAALSVATVATMLSGQTMNINGSSTSCSGNAATATLATKASTLSQGGGTGTGMTFNWSGQGGQPTWLWGSNDGSNIYVWNPSNFSVNYATSAGSATSAGTATSAGSATTAGSCSGNAATATNVAASGITGQTGMWTSAARPGPYRLYRNEHDSAYNVQLTWEAHRTNYWSLRGYLNDGFHAECFVVYSGYADSAGSAGALTTGNTYQVANIGIGVAASNRLHINGDGSNPTIRIDNTAFGSGTSSSRGFFGWLPISISGVTRYIQLYS